MSAIPEGFVLIEATRGREAARAALSAAEQADLPTDAVRAVPGGYLVPAGAEDFYVAPGETPAEEPQETSDGPDESWKNADIEAYAADNGIDLGTATTKANMLAAIAAANEKE